MLPDVWFRNVFLKTLRDYRVPILAWGSGMGMFVPIIFVSGRTDVPMTVQAMKGGAVEFLTKPVNDVALLLAIRTAIERSRSALRLDSELRMLGKCYSTLTPREREVMVLVVSGRLNKQVGFELGISEATVKAHRGQVMRKYRESCAAMDGPISWSQSSTCLARPLCRGVAGRTRRPTRQFGRAEGTQTCRSLKPIDVSRPWIRPQCAR